MSFERECQKVERHWVLALTIDMLLLVLIVGPIWVVIQTNADYGLFVAALRWWPWLAAAEVGLVIYYAICEDRLALETVVQAPKLILFAVILLITAWWWWPKVKSYEEETK